MEGQPPNPIRDLGEQISKAVSIAVEQGLQDVNLSNQAAIKSSIKDLGPKPIVMDAMALREQTLGTLPHPLFPHYYTD
jgi:hypothetical protein